MCGGSSCPFSLSHLCSSLWVWLYGVALPSPTHSVQRGRTLSPLPARAWSWDLSNKSRVAHLKHDQPRAQEALPALPGHMGPGLTHVRVTCLHQQTKRLVTLSPLGSGHRGFGTFELNPAGLPPVTRMRVGKEPSSPTAPVASEALSLALASPWQVTRELCTQTLRRKPMESSQCRAQWQSQ